MTVPVSLLPRVFHRGYRFDGAAMAGGVTGVVVYRLLRKGGDDQED